MSENIRSKNNRAADGTPLPGHPAHLNQEDLQFLQHTVTANNVNMLRSLRETKKKEPTLTLTTMLEKAVRVFLRPTKKTPKPPAT